MKWLEEMLFSIEQERREAGRSIEERPVIPPRFPARVLVRLRRCDGGNEPAGVRWEGQEWEVREILVTWKRMGRWWDGEGERTCFQLLLQHDGDEALAELHYRQETRDWWVVQVLD